MVLIGTRVHKGYVRALMCTSCYLQLSLQAVRAVESYGHSPRVVAINPTCKSVVTIVVRL
jgi:hypothetical protein